MTYTNYPGGISAFVLIAFFSFFTNGIIAQTTFILPTSTFTSASGTPLNFLTTTTGTPDTGAPYTITISDGVVFTLDRAGFDLTTLAGEVTIQIQGADPAGGQIIFDGPQAKITINAGDVLYVDPGNSDAMIETNSFGHDRIITSAPVYKGSDFPAIIAAGGVDGSGNLLPVEWLYFSASEQHNRVNVSWATATEKDNDYFEVQHSNDGWYFETIAEIGGAGTSTVINEYRYVHDQPSAGTNYYRIRQVDYDGNFSDTHITAVQLESTEFRLQTDSNALSLYLNESVEESFNIHITDLKGRMLISTTIPAGASMFEIDLSGLSAGMYVCVTQKGQTSGKLFFKP